MIEIIEVPQCPLCNGPHKYELEVQRDIIVGLRTITNMKDDTLRFTRMFTCPVKGNDYRATIVLHQTERTKIQAVSVKGVANDDQNA